MIPNTNSISISLGLSTPSNNFMIQNDSKGTTITYQDETKTTAENDFEFARTTLYKIITKGQDALDEAIEVAKQSKHPRAFEVVGGMLNNLVSASEKLLNLSKQIKDIEEKSKDSPDVINNNLFVGSTSELQKMLEGLKNG